MSNRKPIAATAQMVHLTAFEIARGPVPDMNRQTSIGAGLHQRGVGDLGLACGESTRCWPGRGCSEASSDRNITDQVRLAKIIIGRYRTSEVTAKSRELWTGNTFWDHSPS